MKKEPKLEPKTIEELINALHACNRIAYEPGPFGKLVPIPWLDQALVQPVLEYYTWYIRVGGGT